MKKLIIGMVVCVCLLVKMCGSTFDSWSTWLSVEVDEDEVEMVSEGAVINDVFIEAAKIIARGDMTIEQYNNEQGIYIEITQYNMQEDGHGIIVFIDMEGYSIVYITDDGGENWIKSEQTSSFITELNVWDDKVLMLAVHKYEDDGRISISYDYGKTFEQINNKVAMLSCEERMYYVKPTIMSRDSECIRLGWYGRWNYDKDIFCIEDYDINFNLIERIYIDPDCEFWNERIKQITYYGQVFPESSNTYLTNKDIKEVAMLKNVEEEYGLVEEATNWIRMAINEIYARKGYNFAGTGYEHFYDNYEWYTKVEKKEINESDLNKYEKYNIDLLVSYEKQLKEKGEMIVY